MICKQSFILTVDVVEKSSCFLILWNEYQSFPIGGVMPGITDFRKL